PGRARRRRARPVPHPLGHRVPGHRAVRPGRLRPRAPVMTATLETPRQNAGDSAPAPASTGAGTARRRELRKSLTLAGGLVVSVLALLTAVTIGTAGVGIPDVVRSIRMSVLGGTISADFASSYAVITQLRLPRVLLAFAAG